MSQIASGSIHKFLTGETVTGDDTQVATNLNIAFELLRLAINDNYQRINNAIEAVTGVGGGVFRPRTQVFVATAGQTVFNLTEGSYTVGNDRLQVYVSGVKQYLDSGDFAETSATAFTLSEGVPVGTKVEAVWIEGILGSATDPIIHASRHAANGADPINITTLAGYDDLNATVPRTTTAAFTFYVNDATGSNTNDGSLAAPFKTIQKAINSIPQIVNHPVNISVANGYYSEIVTIKGFTGSNKIFLTGNTSTPASVSVFNVEVISCSINVTVRGFTSITISRDAFSATNCQYVEFDYNASLLTSSYYGISANNSTVYAAQNTLNNKHRAFSSTFGANLTSYGNSGTGNTYVFYAEIGGTLGYSSGLVPTGTTFSFSDTGGSVTAGVLNPWGDNTTLARSAFHAYSNTNQSIPANVLTKLTCFGNESYDHLNEWSTSTNTFTAKEAGLYVFTLQVESNAPLASGNAIFMTVFVGGLHYDCGSLHTSNAATNAIVNATRCAKLAKGDTVTFYTNSTAAFSTSGNASTALFVTRVA